MSGEPPNTNNLSVFSSMCLKSCLLSFSAQLGRCQIFQFNRIPRRKKVVQIFATLVIKMKFLIRVERLSTSLELSNKNSAQSRRPQLMRNRVTRSFVIQVQVLIISQYCTIVRHKESYSNIFCLVFLEFLHFLADKYVGILTNFTIKFCKALSINLAAVMKPV